MRRPGSKIAACASVAAALGAAICFHELGPAAAVARRAESPKVRVATTGNNSEKRKTIPITRRAQAKRRVVMSMDPETLPDLRKGDRVKLSAELQVTVDCHTPTRSCAGRPYLFNPKVGAKLVLAPNGSVTGGSDSMALSTRRTISCRGLIVGGRQHHCIVALTKGSLRLNRPRALPCPPSSCHVNLVLDAHNRHAVKGDRLVIGANRPGGRIVQDKGRINAIRLRPGSQPPPPIGRTAKRRHRQVSLRRRPTVILSKRLNGLRRNEQLAVLARMRTDVSKLPYAAKVTVHLRLLRHRDSTSPGRRVARLATLRGEIAEGNGSNCTRAQTPCPYTMVGVLRMLHDARGASGRPIPLYANLTVVSTPKRARVRPGDRLRILRHTRLKVARYRPALFG